MNISARILLTCLQAVLLLSVTASKSKANSEVFPDPETLEYLEQLYQRVKELHRPLVEGEMNLLPEGVPGFANSVICFSDISASAVSDSSRVLRFDLRNNLADSDNIAAIDLVLRQAPGEAPYETHLHEISNGKGGKTDSELKLLDSGVYIGAWHTLHVQNLVDSVHDANGKRDYKLLLSVSGGNGEEGSEELLRRIKPLLLIYTNDLNRTGEDPMLGDEYPSIGRVSGSSRSKDSRTRSSRRSDSSSSSSSSSESSSDGTRRRRRRSVGGTSSGSSRQSLEQMRAQPCRVQERTVTYQELGWPGSKFTVTPSNVARFAFCYGTCDNPFSSTVSYTNHARLIGLSEPKLADVAPCCVPQEFTAIPITYTSKVSRVITMTTYPSARSCQCM